MSIFFIIIFAIYGSVHVYAFHRARLVMGFGPAVGAFLALFMLLMVFAPFLIRALERYEYEFPAIALSYLAYCWMAAIFLFFCLSLLFDIAGLLVHAAGWVSRADVSLYLVPAARAFWISAALSLAICTYGFFDARDIRTEKVVIETAKLPAGTDRLTIVQISDVHLGLINRCSRLSRMLAAVKAAKPDIFLSTGDLVDAQINHLAGLSELLGEIKTKYGNYAITGNHEYFAGIAKALEFTKRAGFTMLQNTAVDAGPITIAGVDDRTAVRLHLEKPVSERDLLAKLPRGRFTLFLKHQPLVDPATVGLFDLMLSGHTHKGQIFPFTLITELTYRFIAGTYDLGKGSLLHVSRGTGTWGPPIRFLAPPEVTVIELVRKTGV